ncbi:MAG: hypothetical protein M3Z11_07720 [Candidatus Dormibacteraeota bacterium]|nr:hypothetical protein [Candidatus Dormibacteraeota bacterium]
MTAGRRYGLASRSFWLTFGRYRRYRIRRIWPAAVGVGGLILVIAGAVTAFQWILAYYAARLGHPVTPASP